VQEAIGDRGRARFNFRANSLFLRPGDGSSGVTPAGVYAFIAIPISAWSNRQLLVDHQAILDIGGRTLYLK
jgi:hypothetical protein